MKLKNYLLLASLPIFFFACNTNQENKKEKSDTIKMIDPESSKHLAFKGVPIDGTLKEYVARMQKSGFSLVGTEDGVALLQGDFAGHKKCKVYVSTIEGNDIVSFIIVEFPEHNTWEYLYDDYKHLKELLTEKYGQPSSVKEEFQGYRFPNESDDDKIRKVRMDECKYETRFDTEKGEIVLWIEHERTISTFVCLQYSDKINRTIVKQQAINDL